MTNLKNTSILYTWTYVPLKIKDFLLDAANIDCNPIWQRPDVSSVADTDRNVPSKQQSIMQSIIEGIDIGEIKLCRYQGRKSSIDGGNRKRAIIDFLNNKFPLHKSSAFGAKYYHQLSEDVKDRIMNYDLRFIQYGEMTHEVIGTLFRSTNNTTHVNHQEFLNSQGMNPIARLVRETVRQFQEIGNTKHTIFKSSTKKTKNNNDGEVVYDYFSFNNSRLFMEEIVARILCRIVKGETFGASSDEMLEKMYVEEGRKCEADPKLLETYRKKLNAALDFFEKVVTVGTAYRGNKGVTKRQFCMLVRLYFHIKGTYGEFRVPCYETFWEKFSEAFSKFDSKNPQRKETFHEGEKGTGKVRVVCEAFGGYLAFDRHEEWKVKQTVTWLLQELDLFDVVTILDPKRCFSRDEIEKALIDQGYKCYVDGKPLTMKDSAGAHKKAWSKGGKTVKRNLVAVRSVHNKQSGSMDIDTYKKAMGY
jgi:hypothetical protein